MSKIGDTRPGKSTPSYGSSKTPPPTVIRTSKIEKQAVEQTPKPESWYIATEKRIQDFQDLKAENIFVRQFIDKQLDWLISAIHTIPTKHSTIKEARNTLLRMVDRKVIMSKKDENKEAARQKLISLINSGEKRLEILEQKILKQYPHRSKEKNQIYIIRNSMKRTYDFIQCFNLDKMTKKLDQSKTYEDLLKMRNDFEKQHLKGFYLKNIDKNIYAIRQCPDGQYPDKDAQAARLINILQQIPELKQYITASEQASSSNVMGEQEAGASKK